MVSTKINAEITEYHEKFFLGLSIRQLVCFGVGAAMAVATGVMGYMLGANMDLLSYLIMAEVLPFLALGFFRRSGYPAETYAAIWWRWNFLPQQVPVMQKTDKESNNVSKAKKGQYPQSECLFQPNAKAAKKRKVAARKTIAAAKKAIRHEQRQLREKGKNTLSAESRGGLPTV